MKLSLGGFGVVVLLVGSATTPASAQDSSKMMIANRVMAIVGKTPITLSMVEEELFAVPAQIRSGWSAEVLKTNRMALRDTLVNAELLYQEAVRDTSIHVTDPEVSERADAKIKQNRASLPGVGEFDAALKSAGYKSADEYRQKLLEQTKRQFYIERYSQSLHASGAIKPMNPTEREVRAFYDAQVAGGQMGTIPPSITFKQIVVPPKPTPEAMAKARHLVDSLITALRNGADFSTVARKYSMDPGTKDRGGDFGWHRRGAGDMVREFEDAAFSLKAGTISDPVQTPYGLHIIQIARVQPNEAHIYHILIIPDIDSSAALAARAQAEAIRIALTKGASFDSIQRLVHDMNEARSTDGPYPIDSLPAAYAPLRQVDAGKVSPVMVLPALPPGTAMQNKYAVLLVTGKFPAGPLPYDAARDGIRAGLATQYGENAYLKELRRRIYVDIRNQ